MAKIKKFDCALLIIFQSFAKNEIMQKISDKSYVN